MSIHSTHFTSLYSVPWCWHYVKFQGHPQWGINSRKSYSIQWQSQVYDFSLLERPSERALIRLRCHAQKHSKSKSSCHLYKRNPNKNDWKLWRFYRRFVWQRLIKSGHNLASLLQTTLSPKQALPVLQMHWTNYVVNLEPMALWTTEQQCWAFRNGPSSILEGSSDISREGYHGMVGTRRMLYVSISWFHH